jgi:hypothetical protein
VIQTLEEFALEGKTSALLFARVNHLFESKKITPDTLVSREIDSAETTLTEQSYYIVTVTYERPYWEYRMNILHITPQTVVKTWFSI